MENACGRAERPGTDMRRVRHQALDAGLLAVRDGRSTFNEFAVASRPHWTRLARTIARRWRQPLWTSPEDFAQELLLEASQRIWEWNPARGPSITGYVVWNAYDKAKKAAHKARNAVRHGNADSNPSRTEVNFSRLASRGEEPDLADRRVELLTRVEPTQEARVEQVELYERVLRLCKNARERAVVREAALAGLFEDALTLEMHALVECAQRIYADPDLRLACRLGSEERALQAAVRAAVRVQKRFCAAIAA
jgi:hypothetical protein